MKRIYISLIPVLVCFIVAGCSQSPIEQYSDESTISAKAVEIDEDAPDSRVSEMTLETAFTKAAEIDEGPHLASFSQVPIMMDVTGEVCDTKYSSWGSGATLVEATSEACLGVSGGYIDATAQSDITYCPPGWSDLWHEAQVDVTSGSTVYATDTEAKSASGSHALAQVLTIDEFGQSSYTAHGSHTYQTQTGDPNQLESVLTQTLPVSAGGGI